jgi:hypothetical protein
MEFRIVGIVCLAGKEFMILTAIAERVMGWRSAIIVALLVAALAGCDGKDPDRLNRVGKKLVEKGQNMAEEAHLPRVTIEVPDDKKPDNGEPKSENEQQPGNGEPKTSN